MNYPADDQLVELFNRASAGLLVTDANGRIVLANKASAELLHDARTAGTVLPAVLGIDTFATLVGSGNPIENVSVTFPDDEFSSGFANIGFGVVDDRTYAFWAIRPATHAPLPATGDSTPKNTTGTAESWITRVDTKDSTYVPASAADIALIRGIYDYCPVAIHLIEEDGNVGYANWKDIAIVGASDDPASYVGHHIRQIYADKDVIDDFLGRWGEDSPIIDFRADFLNDGGRVPVVIFSTANVVDGALQNTRCLVFSDDQPNRQRDRIAALDLSF